MAAEESLLLLLHLFDSYWFEHQILKKKIAAPHFLEKHEEVLENEPKLSLISTLDASRIFSDNSSSSQESLYGGNSDFLSPKSVLPPPKKLETILSGKLPEPVSKQQHKEKKMKIRRRKHKDRVNVIRSKSLTELEFEELKGFMDLGFVFCEEDKNSRLGRIIPGLQRFGENGEAEDEKKAGAINRGSAAFSRRPYLSEAWDVMEKRRAAEKKLKRRINAAVGNEMDMKDQLRFWAHSVASTVKL